MTWLLVSCWAAYWQVEQYARALVGDAFWSPTCFVAGALLGGLHCFREQAAVHESHSRHSELVLPLALAASSLLLWNSFATSALLLCVTSLSLSYGYLLCRVAVSRVHRLSQHPTFHRELARGLVFRILAQVGLLFVALLLVTSAGPLIGPLLLGLVGLLPRLGTKANGTWVVLARTSTAALAVAFSLQFYSAISFREAASYPGNLLYAEGKNNDQTLRFITSGQSLELFADEQLYLSSVDGGRNYQQLATLSTLKSNHDRPREILILGSGGDLLPSAVSALHPTATLTVVSPSERLFRLGEDMPWLKYWSSRFCDLSCAKRLQDTTHRVQADPAYFLTQANNDAFDLVLALVPPPSNARNAKYYTHAFYAQLHRVLRPSGEAFLPALGPTLTPNAHEAVLAVCRTTGRNCVLEEAPSIALGDWPFLRLTAIETGVPAIKPSAPTLSTLHSPKVRWVFTQELLANPRL